VSFVCCTEKPQKISESVKDNSKRIQLKSDALSVDKAHTIELILDRTFESTEKIFLDGSLNKTVVDSKDRVIIAVQRVGKLGIYVFNQVGELEAVLGQYGRGPGEFEAISSITNSNDTLWVLDTRLQKISLFSMVDYKHLKDELLDNSLIVSDDKFTKLMKGRRLFSINKNDVLIKFEVLSLFQPNIFTKSVYYRVYNDGRILPPELLHQDRYTMYLFKEKGSGREFGFTAPFTRTSLFTTNQEGDIYTAWNEDFRIKKLNSKGEFIKEFYYEVTNSRLDLDRVAMFKMKKEFIKQQGVPDTWPVLHTLVADDEGRLWVSTITDSDSTFKWYVIDGDNGDLIGSFTLKGKRSDIIPFGGEPFFQIKNGFFYTREYNYDEGIDRIVKYKIFFRKSE